MLDSLSTPSSRRAFYVDVIRASACILVVFSHVFAPLCASYHSNPPSVWWGFNFLNAFIRPSAALYVMISGKIFLGSTREESYQGFVWKRYARLLPPFLVWSLIYTLYHAYQNEDVTVGQALLQMVQGPTEYHLWFMYMILGLYLVMPILKRFVQQATPREMAGVLGVWFAFLIAQFFVPGSMGFGPVTMIVSYGGYTLLGYTLDKMTFSARQVKTWAWAGGAILVFNALATYWVTIWNEGLIDERFYFGAAPLVALQGAALFILLKHCNEESILFRTAWLRNTIHQLGRHSYNVYLSHALVIWLFINRDLGFTLSHDTLGPWLGVPLTTVAVLISSLTLSMIFQKLPILSRLLVISSPSRLPVRTYSTTYTLN